MFDATLRVSEGTQIGLVVVLVTEPSSRRP